MGWRSGERGIGRIHGVDRRQPGLRALRQASLASRETAALRLFTLYSFPFEEKISRVSGENLFILKIFVKSTSISTFSKLFTFDDCDEYFGNRG
jgi:hypothetical protein